jgi:hypothetical protein
MKIQLKFKTDTAKSSRRKVLSELERQGANEVRPLFPGDTDEEFASLYVADCADADRAKKVLDYLKSSSSIDFAEGEVRRRLIR